MRWSGGVEPKFGKALNSLGNEHYRHSLGRAAPLGIWPVTSTSFPLVYIYASITLWEGYVCALWLATLCMILGGFML